MSNPVNILSISGGKDSTAMLLLAIQKAVKFRAVFADTGNEHAAVYDYLEYLETKLGTNIERVKADFSLDIKRKRAYVDTKWREEGVSEQIITDALSVLKPTGNPFLDLCIWKGRFPSRRAQFCTEFLKRRPVEEFVFTPLLMDGFQVESWVGVRAEESRLRAKYPKREASPNKQLDGLFIYRPILSWAVDDVFRIHRKHGIEPNPLYSQGCDRVGCMTCINENKAGLRNIADRFPDEIARIRRWEGIVAKASKRGGATFFGAGKVPGEKITPIDRVISWSRTARGGQQFDLFIKPVVYGYYGLCLQLWTL